MREGPFVRVFPSCSDNFFPLDKPYDDHDKRDGEEDVNEPAEGVGCYDAQEPKNEENDRDGPKHIIRKLSVIISDMCGFRSYERYLA